jgi:hypothetical protein
VGHVVNAESPDAQGNGPLATVIDTAAPRLGIKIIRIPFAVPLKSSPISEHLLQSRTAPCYGPGYCPLPSRRQSSARC